MIFIFGNVMFHVFVDFGSCVGHWPWTTTKTTLWWISRAGHLGSPAKVEIYGWWSRCPSWTSTTAPTYGRIPSGIGFWISMLEILEFRQMVYLVDGVLINLCIPVGFYKCKSWGFLGFDEVQDLLVLKAESMLFLWDIFSQQNLGESLVSMAFLSRNPWVCGWYGRSHRRLKNGW